MVVVLIVLLLTYAVFYLLPSGDPALRFAGKSPTPESLALVRERLGLDQPWYEQYGKFVKNFFAGDEFGWPGLGYSYNTQVPVLEQVEERAPRTLLLILGAAITWLSSECRSACSPQSSVGRRGPSRDGIRPHRDLRAGVLARAHGPLHLLEQAAPDGRYGVCADYGEPGTVFSRT